LKLQAKTKFRQVDRLEAEVRVIQGSTRWR